MIDFCLNTLRKEAGQGSRLSDFGPETAESVRRFHQGIPQYAPTSLAFLPGLAARLGVGALCVKDESTRFGLQSFKSLGGSYAVARILQKELGLPPGEPDFAALRQAAAGRNLTLATATDGNHGRGIAWTARQFGQKAVVYMPKGSAEERVRHIQDLGAECVVTECNYDDTVRLITQKAEAEVWILVQDTAWPGYEEIPRHICQGYLTLALEAAEQFEAISGQGPTHLFLQAGVGSFAAAILGFFVSRMGKAAPVSVIVEPETAGCLFTSIKTGDGQPHAVGGALETIMAGLACGEPSSLSWPVIRDYAHGALICNNATAALGMRILASPLPGDMPVVSGESGAAPLGALAEMLAFGADRSAARQLGLGPDARCLLISTEGNTSPEMYERVVWEGAFPFPR